MCQPNHSIVQFEPPNDNDDNDTHGSGSGEGRLGIVLGKAGQWLRKIGKCFHLSRMGEGHTGAQGHLNGLRETFFLPTPTLYEAQWWNRKIAFDGWYYGYSDREEVLGYATAYANAVSIGSLHALRTFLEASIKRTEYPEMYVGAFRNMLNARGKTEFEKKINCSYINNRDIVPGKVESLIRLCLGMTRKRNLLVPEWADDGKLWSPPSRTIAFGQ